MSVLRKVFWFFVAPLQRLYWFLCRPRTRGVKCLVEHQGEYLLVKLTYGHKKWAVPGGGVKRGETFEQAASRELFEEVGIKTDLQKIGEFVSTREYKIDTVEVYHGVANSPDAVIDGFEVAEAKWFEKNKIPEDRAPSVDRILNLASKL